MSSDVHPDLFYSKQDIEWSYWKGVASGCGFSIVAVAITLFLIW